MKHRPLIAALVATAMVGSFVAVPATSMAQTHRTASQHRQDTKNEWRNLAYAGGLLGLIGALNKDSTLTFVGIAGALYSANRYEQDRKSQNKMDRARAYYFSKTHFVRNGHEYRRMVTYKKGKKYYYFKRVS